MKRGLRDECDILGLSDHTLRDIGFEREARTRSEAWWETQAFFDKARKHRK